MDRGGRAALIDPAFKAQLAEVHRRLVARRSTDMPRKVLAPIAPLFRDLEREAEVDSRPGGIACRPVTRPLPLSTWDRDTLRAVAVAYRRVRRLGKRGPTGPERCRGRLHRAAPDRAS